MSTIVHVGTGDNEEMTIDAVGGSGSAEYLVKVEGKRRNRRV
jgi:hypothetical protein